MRIKLHLHKSNFCVFDQRKKNLQCCARLGEAQTFLVILLCCPANRMASQLLQVALLVADLLFAAFVVRALALFSFAFWARRCLIVACFAFSVYLSTQDNSTKSFGGYTPLSIQVYIYVFLLGFIASWRLTPIGITGEHMLNGNEKATMIHNKLLVLLCSLTRPCRRNCLRKIHRVVSFASIWLPLD